MSEIKSVAAASMALRQQGQPFLLATVVAVHGSSYRRPGARLVIADDRRVAGSVSGGCLEQELIRRGWWHTRETGAALLSFDSRLGAELDGGPQARTGCGGVVEILVEQVRPDAAANPLELVEAAVNGEAEIDMLTVYRSTRPGLPVGARRVIPARGAGQPAAVRAATPGPMATLVERARFALAAAGDRTFAHVELPDGSVQALAERLRPPPHLFVFGGGPDAAPLVAMTAGLGWSCTVWDPQARFSSRTRFAGADQICSGDLGAVRTRVDASARPLAVVMAHDFDHDARALAMLLPSRALYIGVLGPRRRTERLLAAVPPSPARDERARRLHAPVGLPIGAETADEIALAIVAEAQAVLAGAALARARAPGRPRSRHAPPGCKAADARSPQLLEATP
ncbi:MAG TPA: XdhC family protein [Polyangia bacterium]|nr:XdhC family protein [Polyangia bacterium]